MPASFVWRHVCRTWLVHSSPNKSSGEVIVLLQHVSISNKKVRGDGGGRGAGSRLLSAGAVGEKIIPLECQQAMGLIRLGCVCMQTAYLTFASLGSIHDEINTMGSMMAFTGF